MRPILINGDESCYCGKKDWTRAIREGVEIVECYECHYLLTVIAQDIP